MALAAEAEEKCRLRVIIRRILSKTQKSRQKDTDIVSFYDYPVN